MEKIIQYSEEVEFFLNDLIDILFDNEYLGFQEDALNYVIKIVEFINQNISTYPSKTTPLNLTQFGEKFILYKANAQTSWYIFFDQNEHKFLIKFITNNHTDIIKDFNL